MLAWLKARWSEKSTKLALAAICTAAAGFLSGTLAPETALAVGGYALVHAVMPDSPLVNALGSMLPKASVALVAAIGLPLGACATDPTTGASTLSPTGTVVAGIACKVDEIVQPIALPFIAGIPTVGGIAASADAAIGHPLVVKACGDLAASVNANPATAKPVVVPVVASPAAVPTS